MATQYTTLEQDSCQDAVPGFRQRLARFFDSWFSRLAIFCALLAAILLLFWVMYPVSEDAKASKLGAGLLFVADHQVLLLLRNSKHNDKTWGLPGGNVERGDEGLLATATREATEELGTLPKFEVIAEITTKRGKRQQKHYAVFVCNLTATTPTEYVPVLNEEHRSFQWFDVREAVKLKNLHPVVSALFHDPARKRLAAAIAVPHLGGSTVEKRGAGLFLMEGMDVLLLTRNSSHNNATLSVPGGNVDLDDTHLLETARREAVEEMGSCPSFEQRGEVDTRRGKHGQKEFKLFLGAVTSAARAAFSPVLSHESLAWGWYDLRALLEGQQALHPVVDIALKDHLGEIESAFSISSQGGR